MERGITKSRSPMQTLNEICIEYNFSKPIYDVSFQNSKNHLSLKAQLQKKEKHMFVLEKVHTKRKNQNKM